MLRETHDNVLKYLIKEEKKGRGLNIKRKKERRNRV